MSNIDYRKIPWLVQAIDNMRSSSNRQAAKLQTQQNSCNNRKYHIASVRLTALLLLGGSVDKTITWSAPFDNTDYVVEFVLLDLEGLASLTEVSRTASTITVRATAGLAQVSLGSIFMVFGRSL